MDDPAFLAIQYLTNEKNDIKNIEKIQEDFKKFVPFLEENI